MGIGRDMAIRIKKKVASVFWRRSGRIFFMESWLMDQICKSAAQKKHYTIVNYMIWILDSATYGRSPVAGPMPLPLELPIILMFRHRNVHELMMLPQMPKTTCPDCRNGEARRGTRLLRKASRIKDNEELAKRFIQLENVVSLLIAPSERPELRSICGRLKMNSPRQLNFLSVFFYLFFIPPSPPPLRIPNEL